MDQEIASPSRLRTQILLQLLLFAVVFGMLAWSLDHLSRHFGLLSDTLAVFWPLNGVTTALLLTKRKRAWPLILLVVFAATTLGHALSGTPWSDAALHALLNAVEVAIAASILPQFIDLPQWLREPLLVYRFMLGAFFAGPGIAGALAAAYYHAHNPGSSFWHFFHTWALADALGMASTIPLILALCHPIRWRFADPWRMLRSLGMLALMGGTTIGVFAQGHYSLLFILFPVLAVVMFYTGFVGSMMALELICVTAVYLTLHQMGPAAAQSAAQNNDQRIFFLQLFLSYVVLMGFPVSVLLDERRAFAKRLSDRERQYRLLAESSRDIIVLTDLSGLREFVSPACRELLGFEPEELQGQHFHGGIHEEDLALCNSTLQDLRLSLVSDAVLIYRTLTKAGEYVWVEGRLRALTDDATGDVTGALITLRDITEHKRLQRELEEACARLEREASFDGLTDVANRRRFDAIFDQEWRRAAREIQPLAVLLVDIDHFKNYNDQHGHPAGDACLRTVAQVISSYARRPGDLVARYGGEEFALLLPSTDLRGSCEVGEKIREAVAAIVLDHGNGVSVSPTISVGCASAIPGPENEPHFLIEEADRALYLAKANGRNRVEAKPGPRPVSSTVQPAVLA